jgi:hypothetical protein
VKDESIANFGLLIAYVLPGCVALWGLGQLSPTVHDWLDTGSANTATFGGFLYVTLAAIGAGLTASTVRWLVIDTVHHATGIRPPKWDFSRLGERVEAFDLLVEIHYRYHQFYANTLVASAFSYASWRFRHCFATEPWGWPEAAVIMLWTAFWAASRDTLRKYYTRAEKLLGNSDKPTQLASHD